VPPFSSRFLLSSSLVAVVCLASAGVVRAASITVTTTEESPGTDGDCTLGEAIAAANTDSPVDACAAGSGADTITLPAGTYTLSTAVSTAAGESAFVVSTAITITGRDATLVRDPAVTSLRFFEVTGSGDLTLDRLTLSGGLAQGAHGLDDHVPGVGVTAGEPGLGGAIHTSGTLTLLDVVLANNRAAGGRGGSGGNMSNRGAPGGIAVGGAVYVGGGVATALRSTFVDNTAVGGHGGGGTFDARAGEGGAAAGGAVDVAPGASLALHGGKLRRNRAEGGNTGFCSPSGLCGVSSGASSGGAVFTAGTSTITVTVLADNHAVAGSGYGASPGRGGAIAVLAGTLALADCVVTGNTAIGGTIVGLFGSGGAGRGGGVYVENAAADVRETALVGNTSVGVAHSRPHVTDGPAEGGGASAIAAVLAFTNTTVSGNGAAQNGGGFHGDAASTVNLSFTTVSNNTSAGGAGGIFTAGSVTLTGSIVAGNTGATGNCSGTIGDGGSNLQYPGATCGGIPVADPLLGPLEAGAGTFYHPPLPGSPARDTAAVACPSVDQRGIARPLDGDGDGGAACDIGAIEANFPLAPGDLIFRDGFDSGDFSNWSAASTDGGDLSVTGEAALDATAFGMQAVVDDTAGLYAQDDTPDDEDRYRARFYFDANGFDPGTAFGRLRTRIFLAFEEGPTRRLIALVLRLVGDQYSLMARVRQDDQSQADTGFIPITPGPHVVEFDWQRASGPDAVDGSFQLWIDGVSVAQLTALDNSSGIDFVRLGALSVKTGAAGTMYWDAFESRRETYIGP
jgi:hypothetical protein